MSFNYSAFENTIIDENSPQIEQPSKIKKELKPHQLAMIYQMLQLENPSCKNLDVEDNRYTLSYETSFGCICDKVGSGKSLTLLGLLALEPILKPTKKCHSTMSNIVSLYTKIKNIVPINILVVPHGIVNQWTQYIQNDTSLDFKVVKNKKTLEENITAFEKYFENKDENLSEIQCDLYLVSSTMYNKFIIHIGDNTISRLIVDEVDSIKVPGSKVLNAEFTWFISSSKTILENPLGQTSYEPYSYTGWNGNVYNVQRRVVNDRIPHTGYFRDVLTGLSRSNITAKIYLNSNEEFIKKSFSLPEYNINIIKCKNTKNHTILKGIIDNDTLNMINAGDIKGAMENVGCETHSEETLINLVTKKLNSDLHDKKLEYEYKSGITYTNQQAKIQALKKIEDQIKSIEEKIECIKLRILENKTCPICYDDINNKVIVTCCNNPFCFECISLSLSHKEECPVCRDKINVSNLIVLDEEKELAGSKEEEKIEQDEDREKLENFKIYLNKKMEESKKKILIFSEYEGSFKKIKEYLGTTSYKFSELKGTTTSIDNIVKKYKSDNDDCIDILLLNAKYFGSGLNLQNTTDIFLYHKMGDPMTKQVIGRAQRPGRTEPLTIWRLCYENEI